MIYPCKFREIPLRWDADGICTETNAGVVRTETRWGGGGGGGGGGGVGVDINNSSLSVLRYSLWNLA